MTKPPVTVLVYHGVEERVRRRDPHGLFVSGRRFADHMAFLARRREVVPLGELGKPREAGRPPRVAITFDDGFRSVLTEAVPILRRHGFPATFFITTGWLGDVAGAGTRAPILSREDVRELADLGYEVGSHGHTHLDCAAAARGVVESDLVRSRDVLAEILGHAPRTLAWPFGRFSEAALQVADECGFERAFGTDHPHESRLAVPRVPVYPSDDRLLFAFKTGGSYVRWRRSAATTAAFAILRPLWRVRTHVVR